ncbi:MAG: GntR family transcriptional regulator [Arthrobacter sp.]|uniref:GntR family transcriptional regulator n=1 Tax=unclassified Arthrobacter TaxID=235627 RepID=UPI00264FE4E9|nr:GntR family transcriptional regulator [Micrococcaceae bacterium]MDN5812920.1 GntR family transcriptional regulator [Micrococcaceae bacterium]MDN5823846.1 GntR family transcriptional regulator [Micrococcaceae bacterium]MDN5878128.1 GntR family transcriptional regulator [Micrococcaceae bacterium]MDN5885881.1 GntR family transcriptional regulator [Micrococcaceae bacterium]
MNDDVLDFVAISKDVPENPYDQIRQQILEAIGSGKLVPGTRLTSVRALAGRLGVAVNTVARSYRELEQAGAVQTRGRHGTVVLATGSEGDRRLASAAQELASQARTWGVGEDRAVEFLRAAFRVQ